MQTKGQQFAKDMRHFLSIGTRTRRDRKGLDLHLEIADWARVAAMEPGTLHASQEATFRPAFDAACSWYKHIKTGRASNIVLEHVNSMSPWQFCALLGQMIDADVRTTSQGGEYFDKMRAELYAQAA
jgi:hypothetical protein